MASLRHRAAGTIQRARPALEALESRLVPTGMPAIGMNVESVVDWSSAWTFSDAFKASRPWISHAYNTATGQESWEGGGAIHVDSRGWPTTLNEWTNAQGQVIRQRLGTLMFRDIGARYPAGTYRAEWKGTGTLEFGFAATATETGTLPDGTRFANLQVVPDNNGIHLAITSMSASDPVRDIRVWMPGTAGQPWSPGSSGSPFHPKFLEKLDPFDTIRFMDWAETNSTDIVSWSDLRPFDHATQQSGEFRNGVSPEYMVELCNEIDANAWVNMPHMADDDFVRRYATLVRDTLEPGRKVFVEWSNETWNGGYGFEGFQWVTEQLALPENSHLQGDRWAFVAREARRDFDIWSEVFAGQADRLVRVVAGQQANSWIADQIASHMDGRFDAISCSAYIHLDDRARSLMGASTTPGQVIDALLGAVPAATAWVSDHKRVADDWAARLGRPIGLVAYEAGPHLDGQNQPYQNAFFEAGSNPRMREVYSNLLAGCRDAGLDSFLQYSLTGALYPASFGAFGALDSIDQNPSAAPKYQALLDAMAGTIQDPLVSIEVVSAAASENGPTSGILRLTRSGSTSQATTVALVVSGTAGPDDFATLPVTVVFAPGEMVKTIPIVPTDDSLAESAETVVVSLGSGEGYAVNPSAQAATVSIADNDFQAGSGLLGRYYDMANLRNPTVSRIDRQVNFNWGSGAPAPGVGPDRFSARWTGYIMVPVSGMYQFRTASDDGVRLWVNGALRVGNWTTHSTTINTSAAFFLDGGRRVPVMVDYFDNTGAALVRLDWRRVGAGGFAVVPQASFATADLPQAQGTGLNAQYFDLATQPAANASRVDAGVNFRWGTVAPVEGVPSGPFAARWTGMVQAIEAGVHQLRVTADSGFRLWVGGVLRIDRADNRATATASVAVSLAAGQQLPIRLEYYGLANRSLIRLDWRRPGAAMFSNIPPSQLSFS
ncbi:MAG: hypothetical protein KJS91_05980 [Planctomycetes bacterium]|nr:hypothetical protein [Planctomycetota bacterium]